MNYIKKFGRRFEKSDYELSKDDFENQLAEFENRLSTDRNFYQEIDQNLKLFDYLNKLYNQKLHVEDRTCFHNRMQFIRARLDDSKKINIQDNSFKMGKIKSQFYQKDKNFVPIHEKHSQYYNKGASCSSTVIDLENQDLNKKTTSNAERNEYSAQNEISKTGKPEKYNEEIERNPEMPNTSDFLEELPKIIPTGGYNLRNVPQRQNRNNMIVYDSRITDRVENQNFQKQKGPNEDNSEEGRQIIMNDTYKAYTNRNPNGSDYLEGSHFEDAQKQSELVQRQLIQQQQHHQQQQQQQEQLEQQQLIQKQQQFGQHRQFEERQLIQQQQQQQQQQRWALEQREFKERQLIQQQQQQQQWALEQREFKERQLIQQQQLQQWALEQREFFERQWIQQQQLQQWALEQREFSERQLIQQKQQQQWALEQREFAKRQLIQQQQQQQWALEQREFAEQQLIRQKHRQLERQKQRELEQQHLKELQQKQIDTNEELSEKQQIEPKQETEIVDMHHYFVDDTIKNYPNKYSLEYFKLIFDKAKNLEDCVNKFSGDDLMGYFILHENLMILIEIMDKIRCENDETLFSRKIDIIHLIQEIIENLDSRKTCD